MRKKSIITLAISSLFLATVGGACAGFEQPSEYSLSGFDVLETLEVNYGASVDLENPLVIDSDGILLDCWTLVTDANGNYIPVNAGQFRADDLDGYTITYIVRAPDNTVYTKTTAITVKSTGGETTSTVTIDVSYVQFVSVGESISIDAVCSNETAVLEYTVTRQTNGNLVEVTGNTFTLAEEGGYTVKVQEENGAAEYTYQIFAEAPLQEGEVETYGASWLEKESFISGKRQDWGIVTSDECGIRNPYGQEASFVKYTTDNAYPKLYINIREDVDYYKQLAEQGYEYVSMWIYMESEKPHKTVSDRDPNAGFYRVSGPTLYPGQWIEYRLSILDERETWHRSFTTCYSYYQNETHHYLQVDNSNEYNTWGGGDTMTFYIADIFAVKPVEITTEDGVEQAKQTGDTVDLSTVFNADCDLTYAVTYRGETVALTGNTYTFPANGEFKITAYPAQLNFSGSATVSFAVTDGYTLTGRSLIKERTDTSVSIDLSELELAFEEKDGVTPVIEGTRVYHSDGTLAEVTNNSFKATKDGMYVVEVKGVYTVDTSEYISYRTFTIDVYSQATKYAVIDQSNVLFTSIYGSWDGQAVGETGEFEVQGKMASVKASGNNQSVAVYAKPFYSKNYYEKLFAEEKSANVTMDLFVEVNSTLEEVKRYRGLFGSYTANSNVEINQWTTLAVSLEKFLNEYDVLVSVYEQYKALTESGVRPAPSTTDLTGAWYCTYGAKLQRTAYMSFDIQVEASEFSATLKSGAKLTVDRDNDLSRMLEVRLDGATAQIESVSVYFNEAWTPLENSIFRPVWPGEYTFRITARTADGHTYKTFDIELSTPGDAFKPTTDNTLYRIVGNEDFNLSTLLSNNYEYEIEVYKMIGEQLVDPTNEVINDTTIKGSRLSVGAYRVEVYALDGQSEFGRILYYTLTVDYDATNEYVYLNDGNEALNDYVIHSANWGNQNSNTLSWNTFDGKDGKYVALNVGDESKNTWEVHVIPVHSKAYYEALAADTEYEYTFKYDFIVNPTGDATNKHEIVNVFQADTNSTRSEYADATWHTRTLTIKEILANWDNLMDVSKNPSNSNQYAAYAKHHLLMVKGSGKYYPYIGNFRMESAVKTLKTDWTDYTAICASNTAKREQMTLQTNWADNQYGLTIWCSTVTNPLDKTGTYLKLINPESKDPIKWNVKNYYYTSEDLAALITKEGALTAGEYKLTFEAYVEDTANANYKMWQYVAKNGGYDYTDSATITANQWYTIEIDLAAYLSYEASGKKPYIFSTNSKTVTAYYLGNMKLEQGAVKGSAAMSLTKQGSEQENPDETTLKWNQEISMSNYNSVWKCTQWGSSNIGAADLDVVSVDGKDGKFVTLKAGKESVAIYLYPSEDLSYYQSLVEKGSYKLVYEFCIFDRVTGTPGTGDRKATLYDTDFTNNGFDDRHTFVDAYTWYTVEIDLRCLITDSPRCRVFYVNIKGYNIYAGNFRLVEGSVETDNGVPMKYIKGEPIA